MGPSSDHSALTPAQPIRLGSRQVDRVTAADPHLYRFRLRTRSDFRLEVRKLQANADVELLQDRNRNQRLDPGEIIASSRAPERKADFIHIEGLSQGTYYVRVFATEEGDTAYQLTLSAAATARLSPAYDVVLRTNAVRSQYGLLPLAVNTQLSQAAQRYAQEMALRDNFSHTGADGSSPWDRIRQSGYRYSQAAENLAAGHLTAASAIKGWFNSAGHRYNMLAYQVQEIGTGYYYLKNDPGIFTYEYYWSQVFGTPSDRDIRPTVPEGLSKD